MDNNFPLLNCSKTAALGNYAAIPGTGPVGAVCSGCQLLTPQGSKFTCSKFRLLTGRAGKPISPASSACRHYVHRAPFNSVKGAV